MKKLNTHIPVIIVFLISTFFGGIGVPANAGIGIPWTSLPPQPLETIVSAEKKWKGVAAKLDVSTFPPADEDIQSLLSSEITNKDFRPVFQRLKQRGKEILPQLHSELAKTDLTSLQKRRLIILLAVNKDSSSLLSQLT